MSAQLMAMKRIRSDLTDIQTHPPDNCSAELVGDDIMTWEGTIIGPSATPWEGGIFKLSIKLPPDYPFRAPHVKFITKTYHPNISENGDICVDILKNEWSPAYTIGKVLLAISSLLANPNPDDPLFPEAARLYIEKRDAYDQTVKDYVKKYATPS